MRQHNHARLLVLLTVFVTGPVSAAEWGDLTAKFVLDGSIPAAKPIVVTKDQELCGKFNLTDERLVVNKANNGIANVALYLYLARGDTKPPIHDSYKATEKGSVKIDNKNCRFDPRMLAVRTSQTLEVGNGDPVGHNTNITTLNNPGQNVLVPSNGSLKITLPADERLPSLVSCNIHPWMNAYLVIQSHPYMGISDADGKVTIKNLPAGKWTFQMWQEASGYIAAAKQNNKPMTWMRGRVEVTIKPGMNDLGEIKVPLASFKLN